MQSSSTYALHVKRKRCKNPPLLATYVRRSSRIKHNLKGFKSSHCADKNCFGCSVVPPTLSTKVIKNLGQSFCKITPKELTDATLNAKKKSTKAAIGPNKETTTSPKKKTTVAKKASTPALMKTRSRRSRMNRGLLISITAPTVVPFLVFMSFVLYLLNSSLDGCDDGSLIFCIFGTWVCSLLCSPLFLSPGHVFWNLVHLQCMFSVYVNLVLLQHIPVARSLCCVERVNDASTIWFYGFTTE